jgi:alkanesulfonate monooxygenase SsuD/methylene tetrahydromethanopterin reductase-like flavin-dependent oxidoreductase (luciferase family)
MTTGTVTTNAVDRAATPENAGARRRFGIMVMLDAAVETMLEQARQAEALGFDQVFFPDHMGDFRNMAGPWFDGWSMIAAAAIATKTIRIGALVSNPILRAPALLAKQAITVDHLSGGRLDLGIGAGLFAHDHHAVGSEPWQAKERAERFAEYVEIVDGVLRGAGQPYSFDGRWLWARDVPTAPGPVQQPRPPLIVGGQSPTVRRVAAAWADVWDTHGPIGASFEEILETTARQNRELDEFCSAAGRNPASLRRSLTTLLATDPWSAPVSFEEVVERFTPAGITEFVIGWPPEDRLGELERLAQVVMPGLRES